MEIILYTKYGRLCAHSDGDEPVYYVRYRLCQRDFVLALVEMTEEADFLLNHCPLGNLLFLQFLCHPLPCLIVIHLYVVWYSH